MTVIGPTAIVSSFGLVRLCFAVLMQFLAGLDRVQPPRHQHTPALLVSVA